MPAQVRAPVTKAILELLEELPAEDRDAIRAGAPAAVTQVEGTARSDRLPLSVQLEILEQVDARLGRAGYLDLCRTHFTRTVNTPLVRPILDGAVRLFGMSPKAIFKMFSRTWSMMSTEAGLIECVRLEPDTVEIVVRDLPMEERRADLFIEGFAATFSGVLDLFDVDGSIELAEVDEEARSARYTGRWTARE